jgi:DNA primase
VLKRFVDGAEGEAFYQKRAPEKRPDWLRTVTLAFPSAAPRGGGRRRRRGPRVDREPRMHRAASAPGASGALEHPDELRVDLDPGPGVRGPTCAAWRSR